MNMIDAKSNKFYYLFYNNQDQFQSTINRYINSIRPLNFQHYKMGTFGNDVDIIRFVETLVNWSIQKLQEEQKISLIKPMPSEENKVNSKNEEVFF